MQLFILFVIVTRVIAPFTQGFDLRRGITENEDVLFTDVIQHFNVGPIQRTDGQRAIQRKLHITGAGRLRPCGRDLLREIGRRNNDLRQAHAVVRDEDHLQFVLYLRIVIDHIRNIVDQMNDVLGNVISRRRFTGKDIDAWHPIRLRIGLDTVVSGDHMQHVEQLTFVLVNTLDLHIKQRVRVEHHVQILRHPVGQPTLVLILGDRHFFNKRRIVDLRLQLAQLAEIGAPVAANLLIQHL